MDRTYYRSFLTKELVTTAKSYADKLPRHEDIPEILMAVTERLEDYLDIAEQLDRAQTRIRELIDEVEKLAQQETAK